ncbi:MAG: hemolysin family protein [Candidatus Nanopelagicales bacterium]|nr:hemolysin family protein [Candidatus Nanopelagicales bacterium]
MSEIAALVAGLLVVMLITVATGYFVAQEFAYMAVDRSRLRARSEAGDARATRALSVTNRTSFMLSGAQLGITVTGLLVGYVAEPLIGGSLGSMLGGAGVPVAASVAIGGLIALGLSTVIQMLFGELFPKNLAISRPEPLALRLAASTTVYLKVMGWLISFFDRSSNRLLRALKIEPVHDVQYAASASDLEHIVADSRDSGDLSEELSVLIDRILDFPDQDVEHAMIPRSRVDTVDNSEPIGQVRARMARGHSRYPVTATESDDVVGVVHLVDVLSTQLPDHAPVGQIVRPAVIVATLMSLPDALALLEASSNQLACAVDEYGGFAGVLTIEDLAEELVGEITDEHDPADPYDPEPGGDDGVWVMSGSVHVDEAERALGVDLPAGDFETVAGLVIAEHGGLPASGTTVDLHVRPTAAELALDPEAAGTDLRLEVLEVTRHVPSKVRITVVDRAGAAGRDHVPPESGALLDDLGLVPGQPGSDAGEPGGAR